MEHIIIYVTIIMLMIMSSCTQRKTDEVPVDDSLLNVIVDSTSHYDYSNDSVTEDKPKTSTQEKPVEDNRSFYERGYDEGYDNGREDGTMDLGDGYSYCDDNPYKGATKRDYEYGYKHGYRKGYNEGFYEYSDGDEEDYDEY